MIVKVKYKISFELWFSFSEIIIIFAALKLKKVQRGDKKSPLFISYVAG